MLLGFLIAGTMGCTSFQLERSAANQVDTFADIHYRQVLNNLARFTDNPGVLPSFAVAGTATPQVADQGTLSEALTWSPDELMSHMLTLSVQRNIQENWALAPVTDPDRLKAMRCAYQILVMGSSSDCVDCQHELQKFLTPEELGSLPAGWFHVGRKRDVPKDACYIGRACHKYVWVMPDGVDGLTRFTLLMFEIASVKPPSPEEKRAVPAAAPRQFKDYYNPLQGLINLRH